MRKLTDKQVYRLWRILDPRAMWFKTTKSEVDGYRRLAEMGLCQDTSHDRSGTCWHITPAGMRAVAAAYEQGRLWGVDDRVSGDSSTIGMQARESDFAAAIGPQAEGGSE